MKQFQLKAISWVILVTFMCTSAQPVFASSDSQFQISYGEFPQQRAVPVDYMLAELEAVQVKIVPVERAAHIHLLESRSPLSPVELSGEGSVGGSGIFNPVHAADLPDEEEFVDQFSTGVYVVEIDDFFKALISELLDPAVTDEFEFFELINVELFALRQRIEEGLAALHDFVVMFPTQAAINALPNFGFINGFGALPTGLGAAEVDNIDGIGFDSDDPSVERLNEVFGPIFGDLFSEFQLITKNTGPGQGLAWINLVGIDAFKQNLEDRFDLATEGFENFVLLQELAHRWGTFLSSDGQDGNNPLGILGREESHWSDFFNGGSSPMDGVAWIDNGDGTFTIDKFWGLDLFDAEQFIHGFTTTVPVFDNQFNDFDLYAMGLLAPADVAPSFVLSDVRMSHDGTALSPGDIFAALTNDADPTFFNNPTVTATRTNVTINDVIAIEGARRPTAANSQTNFSGAFLPIRDADEGNPTSNAIRNRVRLLARDMADLWSHATRTLSTFTMGPLAGAFDIFIDVVGEVFDLIVDIFKTGEDPDGNSVGPAQAQILAAETREAQDHSTELDTLDGLLAQVDALLMPLQDAGVIRASVLADLGNLPTDINTARATLQGFRPVLQGALGDIGDPDAAITTGRALVLAGANQASGDGTLPVGFGRTADNALDGINDTYTRVNSALQTVNHDFDASAPGLTQTLNDAITVLANLTNALVADLGQEVDTLQTVLTNRGQELTDLIGDIDGDFNDLVADRDNLGDRTQSVIDLIDQTGIGDKTDLTVLLNGLGALAVPTAALNQLFGEADTLRTNLLNDLTGIESDLTDFTNNVQGAPSLADLIASIDQVSGQAPDTNVTAPAEQRVTDFTNQLTIFQNNFEAPFLASANEIAQLIASLINPNQTTLDGLLGLRTQQANTSGTLRARLVAVGARLPGVTDAGVQTVLQNELNALLGQLDAFDVALAAEGGDLDSIDAFVDALGTHQTNVQGALDFIGTPGLLTDPLAAFQGQVDLLAAAGLAAKGPDATTLVADLGQLSTNLNDLLTTLNQLATDVTALEDDVDQAFIEQANREAEEQALDAAVDALVGRAADLRESVDALGTALEAANNAADAQVANVLARLQLILPIVPGLNGLVAQINAAGDFAALQALFDALDASLDAFEIKVAALAALRDGVLADHSLATLREAKELLEDLLAEEGDFGAVQVEIQDGVAAKQNALPALQAQIEAEFENAIADLRDAIADFLASESPLLDGLQTELDNQNAAFNASLVALDTIDARITNLQDAGTRVQFEADAAQVRSGTGAIQALFAETGIDLGLLTAAHGGLGNDQTALNQFLAFVQAGNVFTASIADLTTQIAVFDAAAAFENPARLSADRLRAASDLNRVSGLQTALDNAISGLSALLDQAFIEQANQAIEEQALNDALDALAAQFAARALLLANLIPDLEDRLFFLRAIINQSVTRLNFLGSVAPDALPLLDDTNALKTLVVAFGSGIATLQANFAVAEGLLAQLEDLRTQLNQSHTLLDLRAAKALLEDVQAAFDATSAVDNLDSTLAGHEASGTQLVDGANNVFQNLSEDTLAQLQEFTAEQQAQVDAFVVLVSVAEASLNDLLAQANLLALQAQSLTDPTTIQNLQILADLIELDFIALNALIAGAQALVPGLNGAIAPLGDHIDPLNGVIAWILAGNFFRLPVFNALPRRGIIEAALDAIASFPVEIEPNPFLSLEAFQPAAFGDLITSIGLGLGIINAILNPTVLGGTGLGGVGTHFSIFAFDQAGDFFGGEQEGAPRTPLGHFQRTIAGLTIFLPFGFFDTEDEEEEEVDEEAERAFRKWLLKFMIVGELERIIRGEPAIPVDDIGVENPGTVNPPGVTGPENPVNLAV